MIATSSQVEYETLRRLPKNSEHLGRGTLSEMIVLYRKSKKVRTTMENDGTSVKYC
jgi:hypothetical protein